jgi:hypothetical protein
MINDKPSIIGTFFIMAVLAYPLVRLVSFAADIIQ